MQGACSGVQQAVEVVKDVGVEVVRLVDSVGEMRLVRPLQVVVVVRVESGLVRQLVWLAVEVVAQWRAPMEHPCVLFVV